MSVWISEEGVERYMEMERAARKDGRERRWEVTAAPGDG